MEQLWVSLSISFRVETSKKLIRRFEIFIVSLSIVFSIWNPNDLWQDNISIFQSVSIIIVQL